MADNLEIIKCPACGKEMKKIFMPEQGVNLDVCLDGCGGIFFDNREFKLFDEQHENIEALEKAIEGKTFIKVDEANKRKCPICGSDMVKNKNKDLEIDECYFCGGKFLDHGELHKFRNQYVNDEARKADLVKELYEIVGAENFQAQPIRRSPLNNLFYSLIRKL